MEKYHIPQPQKIRNIRNSFAWIDHRLMRNGFIETMTHQDMALYLFLVLAADKNGVSFYRKEKICQAVSLDYSPLNRKKPRDGEALFGKRRKRRKEEVVITMLLYHISANIVSNFQQQKCKIVNN